MKCFYKLYCFDELIVLLPYKVNDALKQGHHLVTMFILHLKKTLFSYNLVCCTKPNHHHIYS